MSDGYRDIDNVGTDLLKSINDENIAAEVQQVEMVDPFYNLKIEILDFFKGRMKEISMKDKLLKKINDRIFEKLDEEDLTLSELQSLYNMYAYDSRLNTDSILSLFRPTAGAPSVLADSLGKKEEKNDAFEAMYEKMSSEDLQKIGKLVSALTLLDKEKE